MLIYDKQAFEDDEMPNQSKKIVFWGTVLTTVSFVIGLFHSVLPNIIQIVLIAALSIPFILVAGLIALAFSVFTAVAVACVFLFANPLGILLVLGAVFIFRYRKLKAKA